MIAVAHTDGTHTLIMARGLAAFWRGTPTTLEADNMTKHAALRSHAVKMTEALQKAKREIAATQKEGRTGEWTSRRKRELLAEAAEVIQQTHGSAKMVGINERVDNLSRRPKYENWPERQYTALAAQQDVSNLRTAAAVVSYYRANAGFMSPAARQDLDRVCRNRLTFGDLDGSASVVDLEQARRDFLTADELAFEQTEAELAKAAQVMDIVTEWAQLELEKLTNAGNPDSVTIDDLARTFDLYLSAGKE